jgi:hypothetical protein
MVETLSANKLKPLRAKKSVLRVIALITLLVASSLFAVLPLANAHTPSWEIPTYAYVVISPNPIGANQTAFIVMWLDKPPPTAAGAEGDRWTGFTITVTKPDGKTEKLGPFTSDATSSTYTLYKPTQVGTYTFEFKFPGQVASLYNPITGKAGSASDFVNDTYLASSATATLNVREESVSEPPTYPLPTSYWTRPIEGQNTAWMATASNWLGQVPTRDTIVGVQPNGAAPNSGHVMWTEPIQFGGVVGGTDTAIPGLSYYTGLTYEMKFTDPVIMQGRLYYSIPLGNNAKGGGYVCVDLTTGEKIWSNDSITPSFGQIYDYESMNQHGAVSMLWEVVGTKWNAYDPFTGKWMFSLTNVPSGKFVTGSDGSVDLYVLNATKGWLAMWNNTAAIGELAGTTGSNAWQWRPIGKTIDASNAYSWNISLPSATISSGATIVQIIESDILLGRGSLSGNSGYGTPDPYSVWAISLKPSSRGVLLWAKNYAAPSGNVTRGMAAVDTVNRVFTMRDKETMEWYGYNIDTGEQLWGPVQAGTSYDYYTQPSYSAYGNLYFSGYGGILYCVDTLTGTIEWMYGNGGEGNSTFSGSETPWGNYPLFISTIAGGKVYIASGEHSPNDPLYKGSMLRCINAYDGTEEWTLTAWAASPSYSERMAIPIADGYLVFLNAYDMQLYCIGKGPSDTTVTAASGVGNSVTIQGTVTDKSCGAKQLVETGEFNIVPAVSDSDQSAWMAYLYQQKPMPINATGVTVSLYISDQSGNVVDTIETTSDVSGHYATAWTPPSQGLYTVTAAFDGSESYYPSTSVTSFSVGSLSPSASVQPTVTATPTATPTTTASPSVAPTPPGTGITTEVYITITAVAIIVVIAIVAVFLRRHK